MARSARQVLQYYTVTLGRAEGRNIPYKDVNYHWLLVNLTVYRVPVPGQRGLRNSHLGRHGGAPSSQGEYSKLSLQMSTLHCLYIQGKSSTLSLQGEYSTLSLQGDYSTFSLHVNILHSLYKVSTLHSLYNVSTLHSLYKVVLYTLSTRWVLNPLSIRWLLYTLSTRWVLYNLSTRWVLYSLYKLSTPHSIFKVSTPSCPTNGLFREAVLNSREWL